ncbi:hypothetical protein AYI70_g9170, partial [Smittium culicis]
SEYFVGYVEDDESVEAIMKKFNELDKIKDEFMKTSASSEKLSTQLKNDHETAVSDTTSTLPDNNEPQNSLSPSNPIKNDDSDSSFLPQELLAEVFKRTSAFTVKGAMMDEADLQGLDDVELWKAEMDDSFDYDLDEQEYYDLEEDDFWDDEFGSSKNKSKGIRRNYSRISSENKASLRDQILQRYKYMQVQVKDKRGFTFFINRKVLTVDPYSPTYIRIPPLPIPRSWVNTIQPLNNPTSPLYSKTINSHKIIDMNWKDFSQYHAVYMDPPLKSKINNNLYSSSITVDQLKHIPVNKILRPGGFLFIWCEKEFLPAIFSISESAWNLKYVENFCWIIKLPNNRISRAPSRYFCKSKLTCLIFRNHGDIEMRHQRSPDCEETERKPEFVYNVIETLLPMSICSEDSPSPDRLLNLWSPKGFERTNWTTVSESPKD